MAIDGRTLYFCRATIPNNRGLAVPPHKHLSIYAAKRPGGVSPGFPSGPLEFAERLEQLRLLENGMGIYVEHKASATVRVDTGQDLQAAEWVLRQQLSRS